MPDTPPPTATKKDEESIKETIESIVIALILAFVFRAYVVEAFVIPTGSMAPTLLGEHVRVRCEQCGYDFKVERPSSGNKLSRDVEIFCPMCHHEQQANEGTYISSGDRILVNKVGLTDFNRFDVVVFKAPHHPHTNYIKRLIGLPGQELLIIDGDIFYNPTPGDEKAWRIARKTDPEENPHAWTIQRTVWQPVHHSRYVPLRYDPTSKANKWLPPWRIVQDDGNGWRRAAASTLSDADPMGDLNPKGGYAFEGAGRGTIAFDFRRAWRGHGESAGPFVYGQQHGWPSPMYVEDVRLAAGVQAMAAGLTVRLQTTARLDDKQGVMRRLWLQIDPTGWVTLHRSDRAAPLQSASVTPFDANGARRVELWYVDQEASAWVDGKRLFVHRFDLPIEDVKHRASPGTLWENPNGGQPVERTMFANDLTVPLISIEVAGAAVTLHNVEVDRDLYYTDMSYGTRTNNNDPTNGIRGGELGKALYRKDHRHGGSGDAVGETDNRLRTTDDEFFCLGDNSPFSSDGRVWNTVDPWVLERSFATDEPLERAIGVVPRRLMIGRAFFVYWPSMLGIDPTSRPIFPNFGEMRFIH